VIEPRPQPGPLLDAVTAQGLRVALREGAARHRDRVHDQAGRVERDGQRGVAGRRVAQQVEVLAQDVLGRVAAEVLEIDGNLGAGDIQARVQALRTRGRPCLGRQDVGRGELAGWVDQGRIPQRLRATPGA
jgi:hypothetical protein